MDHSSNLARKFTWADVVIRCALQTLGSDVLQDSLICTSGGSDSDFTGGADAWSVAAESLTAAARGHGLPLSITPQTICES